MDEKNYDSVAEDRTEWDQAWSAMSVKHLVTDVDLKQLLQTDFGEILTSTISLCPSQFAEQVYKSSEICPLCGKTTLGVERLSANLNGSVLI